MSEKKHQFGILLDEQGMARGYSGCFSGVLTATTTPAQTILPMIEQRIRNQVRAQVRLMRAGLEATTEAQSKDLGLSGHTNGEWEFVNGLIKAYEEKLVADRIAALVDSLLPKVDRAA